MDNKFHTGQIIANSQKLKHDLPILIANQAQRFFENSFQIQGWDDSSVKNWKEVNRRIGGTTEYKYPKTKGLSRQTSPILVRTGKLRRAVSNMIRSKTFESIKLVCAIPYASYHNDGTDKIPKRQFMGDSKDLRKAQRILIDNQIDKVFHGRN